jgi:hypothetical protein
LHIDGLSENIPVLSGASPSRFETLEPAAPVLPILGRADFNTDVRGKAVSAIPPSTILRLEKVAICMHANNKLETAGDQVLSALLKKPACRIILFLIALLPHCGIKKGKILCYYCYAIDSIQSVMVADWINSSLDARSSQ